MSTRMTLEKLNKAVVVKSNELLRASYALKLWQMRLWLLVISKIGKDDTSLDDYTVTFEELGAFVGKKHRNFLPVVEQCAYDLMDEPIVIKLDDERILHTRFLSAVTFDKKKEEAVFSFYHELKPYLINLKGNFTKYELENISKLQSPNSIRVYQLMKRYEKLEKKEFSIDELKSMFRLEGKYKKPNDFIRNVIDSSKDDLEENKCDVSFTYETKKRGRKIFSIVFFPENKKEEPYSPSPALLGNYEGTDLTSLQTTLKEMGLSEAQISKHLHRPDADLLHIQHAIEITKKQCEKGKVKNIPAYLYKMLESSALDDKPKYVREIEDKQRKEKEQKKLAKEALKREQKKAEEEAQLIQDLLNEFDAVRTKQQNEIVKKFTDKDWRDFEKYAFAMPTAKKLFENGVLNKNHEDLQMWARMFASKFQPDFEEAFVDWALRAKGYHLKYYEREHKFKVIGKQEKLL